MHNKKLLQMVLITSLLAGQVLVDAGCSSESNGEESTVSLDGSGGGNPTGCHAGGGCEESQGGNDGDDSQGGSDACALPSIGICGRASDGIHCGVSNNTREFVNVMPWGNEPSTADDWTHTTVRFPDVNGDGKADVCGRDPTGIYCGVSSGSAFLGPHLWSTTPSDANGWADSSHSYTIQFPDVNGDGRADFCGRGPNGIVCGISDGVAFGNVMDWNYDLSDAAGWNTSMSYWLTLQFPDINGDAKADFCARSPDGIVCGLSIGITFIDVRIWNGELSDSNSWKTQASYWATIQFPDVNGDGKADLCGRGPDGIYCGISNGIDGFGSMALWSNAASDANGWNTDPGYWSTIRFPDINGDGKADFCGRGLDGIVCGISNGTLFSNVVLWNGHPSDPKLFPNIQYPDVNSDGKADYCAPGAAGIYCGLSDGTTFLGPHVWSDYFGDATSWDGPYWTIRFPTLDDGDCDLP